MRERKRLPFELKADKEGAFSAVFATFDVVDHDGDVTRPGAFKAGTEVVVGSWGHSVTDLPTGKGRIGVSGKEAVIEGEFFLETAPGRDTYQTVKSLGNTCEWSYILQPTRVSFGEFEGRQVRFLEEVKVYSVDPVLAGAGLNTRTTDIKSLTQDLPFLDHTAEIAELVADFAVRVKARAEARTKEGRSLSPANVESLTAVAESLKAAIADLSKCLESTEQKIDNPLLVEFLRYQRIRAGQAGVA